MSDKKKYDLAIMNPPYDRNLHLKILEKVIPYAEETINISPIRWLQDPLAKYKKNSDYNKFKESIAEHIKDLQQVTAVRAQSLFADTVMGADLGVYHIDNDKHIAKQQFPKFIERIANFMMKNNPTIDFNKKDGFRVRIKKIIAGKSGGAGLRDLHPLRWNPISKDIVFKDGEFEGKKWWTYYVKNQHSKTTDEITHSIKFNKEIEGYNFIHSYDTTFAKVVHWYIVTDIHLDDTKILWMGNVEDGYKSPWDNKRFCDYFNITGYISDTEAEPGSEWEEILNTMEKYK